MRSNIHNARNTIADLRAALLLPSAEALEPHVPGLESAVRDLEALVVQPGFTSRRELEAFSADLLGVARLIEHGLMFHQDWARLLAASAANYQPNGEPAALTPAGTLSVKG